MKEKDITIFFVYPFKIKCQNQQNKQANTTQNCPSEKREITWYALNPWCCFTEMASSRLIDMVCVCVCVYKYERDRKAAFWC